MTTRSILAAPLRATTAGIVITVTLVAFEAMAVATAMPTAVRELRGTAYYSWPFSAFFVASVVGIVVAGSSTDRAGPNRSLLAGLAIFTVGLLVAGTAAGMAVFVVGRAVQGLGCGQVIVAMYVVIARAYAEQLRPKMFAALSAAWVLPSVVGPLVSGALTEHLSWRWVFLGLPPLIAMGTLLLLPGLRRTSVPDGAAGPPRRARAARRLLLALGAAAGTALLQYGGQRLAGAGLLAVGVGLVLLALSVPRLMPAGTTRLRRGLPAVIALRGLLAGAFFGADAYIPFTLTSVHGFRPTLAGVPLILASLGWASASWWQGRRPQVARHRLIRVGFALVTFSVLTLAPVAYRGVSGWLAAPLWIVGGAGMGLAMPSVSVLTLQLSPPGEQGVNSSALQISDTFCSSVCIAAVGVVVSVASRHGHSLSLGIAAADAVLAVIAMVGVAAAGRARSVAPGGRGYA